MPTVFTPSAAAPPTSYTHPSDGDSPIKAADVTVPLEAIENAVKWIAADNHASVVLDYIHSGVWVPLNANEFLVTAAPFEFKQNLSGSQAFAPLDLPDGNLFTALTIYIKTTSGHGALPGTMPKLSVYRYDPLTGTAAQIGSTTTDPSASVGAYDTLHGISVTGLNHTVNRQLYSYYARFEGEGGANYQNLLRLLRLVYTITVTKRDPAAA